MYLGNFPTVVIYDFELVKELFNRDELQGRPDNFPYRFRMLGKRLGKDSRSILLKRVDFFYVGTF